MTMYTETNNVVETNKSSVPFIGLQNMGNTCYLNSILQVLYHCPGFSSKLSEAVAYLEKQRKKQHDELTPGDFANNLKVLSELSSLFCTLDANQLQLIDESNDLHEDEIKSLSTVRPEKLFSSLREEYPMFEPFTQQDAQECFHCLLSVCKAAALSFSEIHEEVTSNVVTGKDKYRVVGGRKFQVTSVLSSTENKNNVTQLHHEKRDGQRTCTVVTQRKQRKPLKRILKKVGLSKGDKDKSTLTHDLNLSDQLTPNTENSSVTTNLKPDKENSRFVDPVLTACGSGMPPCKKICLEMNLKTSSSKSTATVLGKLLASKRLKVQKKNTCSNTHEAITDVNISKKHTNFNSDSDSKVGNFNCKVNCLLAKQKTASGTFDFVKDMFQGELVTLTKCMECETEVSRLEKFQDVSLPVMDTEVTPLKHSATSIYDEELDKSANSKQSADMCTLSWALSEFTSSERLEGENKYHCDICLRLSEGERAMLFSQLPPVFAFHLKRFSTSRISSNFGTSVSKITSALEIPSSLKFSKWCKASCIEKNYQYELFAVVVHSGTTITGGHYLSYVKYSHNNKSGNVFLSKYDGQWLQMDDEQVHLVSKEEIHKALNDGDFDIFSRSPYMLFYRLINSD